MNGSAFRRNPQRLEGGCDDCTAYRELVEIAPGLNVLAVFHDDSCPTLAQVEGRRRA